MNSKLIVITLILAIGCGVKNPPEVPPGTAIPSYPSKFLKSKEDPSQTEQKKITP